MMVFEKANDLVHHLSSKRSEGATIGFVPTMGSLHSGHLSLIDRASKENEVVVVSIFVNPTQFNNPMDLKNYPRDFEGDSRKLEQVTCHVLFHPSEKEMYPTGKSESFDPGFLNEIMEGKFRPGHFQGVAQVVKRLLEITQPDKAYFGLKDYQQYLVVKSMVQTYELPVAIIGCETSREQNGLAMSSRNKLLSEDGKKRASIFYKSLLEAKSMVNSSSIFEIETKIKASFKENPLCQLEYFQIADAETLKPLNAINPKRSAIACIAGYIDNVRLIDNLILIP